MRCIESQRPTILGDLLCINYYKFLIRNDLEGSNLTSFGFLASLLRIPKRWPLSATHLVPYPLYYQSIRKLYPKLLEFHFSMASAMNNTICVTAMWLESNLVNEEVINACCDRYFWASGVVSLLPLNKMCLWPLLAPYVPVGLTSLLFILLF